MILKIEYIFINNNQKAGLNIRPFALQTLWELR
jgi:hypothetical protein